MNLTIRPQMDVPNSKSGARAIHIGSHIYFYSNDTLVGYAGPGKRVRSSGSIETIRRHQHELGIEDYPRVSDLDSYLPILKVQ